MRGGCAPFFFFGTVFLTPSRQTSFIFSKNVLLLATGCTGSPAVVHKHSGGNVDLTFMGMLPFTEALHLLALWRAAVIHHRGRQKRSLCAATPGGGELRRVGLRGLMTGANRSGVGGIRRPAGFTRELTELGVPPPEDALQSVERSKPINAQLQQIQNDLSIQAPSSLSLFVRCTHSISPSSVQYVSLFCCESVSERGYCGCIPER